MLRLAVARVESVLADIGAAGHAPGGEPPAWLGDAERARWPVVAERARPAFLASRWLARCALARMSGVAPTRWRLSAEAGTAPVAALDDDATPRGAVPGVSLAHRLGWVAAVAGDGTVGVDVERAQAPRSPPADRAALMLCAPELARWHQLPEAQREPALLRAWVAREAWFKAAPAGAVPWDFSRIEARACEPAQANVRTWRAGPLHVALCCGDAGALAQVVCEGLPSDQPADSLFWHLQRCRD